MNRTLHIAWCHTGVTGGAKRAAYDMVRELSRRGHVIDEYILADHPVLDFLPLTEYVRASYVVAFGQLTRRNLRPYVLDAYAWLGTCVWHRYRMTPRLRETARQIDDRGYDVVHIDQHPGAHTVGLLPLLRTPTVVYSHEVSVVRYKGINSADTNGVYSGLKRIYADICRHAIAKERQIMETYAVRRMPHATQVLANSDHTKDLFFNMFGRIPRTSYLGVDHDKFKPLSLARERMVLSVGRLVRPKQHHLIIEAVARVPENERPGLVIATPEDHTQSKIPQDIRRLAEEKNVDLTICWHPNDEKLVALYNQAGAVVYIPVMEPFGLVPLEAMACGTPVIAIKEGGIRETVLDGKTGVLVERDAGRIAEAIRRILGNRDMQREMGQNARTYICDRWTWPIAIDGYEREIEKLLKEAGRP